MSLRGFLLFGLLLTSAFFVVGQTSTNPERRSYVRMFQFSSDSKTVVSYTFEGTLLSWDLESRKLLRSQQVKADNLTFDLQGNLLSIVKAGGGIRLIDVASNKEVKFLEIPDFTYLDKFALSPNGKTLAFTEGNDSDVIKLWDVAAGKEKASIKRSNPDDVLSTMLFSTDGTTLAGLSRSVTLWSAATGKQSGLFKINAGLARMALTPDGKTICVSGFDNMKPSFIKCFGAVSGREVLSLAADPSLPFAFSPDGKVLAFVRHDQGIILVNTATGKEIGKLTISVDQNSLTQMSFSPDGKLLAVAAMEGLVLLDPAAKKELFILAQTLAGP
jgi:WD40 repeat protein